MQEIMSPTPVEELPSYIASNNRNPRPESNPGSKYIIVGSIVLLAIGVSVVLMNNVKLNPLKLNQVKDENGTK